MILPYSLGRKRKIQHRKSGLNITIYLLFSSFLENRSINLLTITAVIDDLWNRFRDYLERVDFEIDLTINLTHKYIPRCRSISFLYFRHLLENKSSIRNTRIYCRVPWKNSKLDRSIFTTVAATIFRLESG